MTAARRDGDAAGARLDPRVLAAVGDLELVARVTVDGAVAGLHRSPFHGYSAEFSQYRHYRAGDDLKYVDWKLFARTDRVYTRQYRETTNMIAQIAIDTSASMGYRGARGAAKVDYARLLAAALAYLVSGQGDAVGLLSFDAQVRRYLPARAGASHLRALLLTLASLDASGGTAAAAPLRRAIDLMRRRGLLVLVSDLYDEDERVAAELTRAARIGHEVAVFHVLTREELEFPLPGELELEDLESRRTAMVGAGTAADYREAFAAFLARWRTRCASQGFSYAQVATDEPLDAALRAYLLGRLRASAR